MEKRRTKSIAILTSAAAALTTIGAATVAAQIINNPSPSPSPSSSASASPSPSQSPGAAAAAEVYTAQLTAANPSLSSPIATASVFVEGDRVGVIVQGQGFAPNVMHEQHIHAGTTCATLADDTNGDGIIDAVEGEAVSGQPIIPFSIDLTAGAAAGASNAANLTYPTSSAAGDLIYAANAPINAFVNSLSQPGSAGPSATPSASASASPSPSATATGGAGGATGGQLTQLEGRVVEIHGIDPTATLPSSVQSTNGQPATATIPVACGVLQRTS